jgi:hypothetical protein
MILLRRTLRPQHCLLALTCIPITLVAVGNTTSSIPDKPRLAQKPAHRSIKLTYTGQQFQPLWGVLITTEDWDLPVSAFEPLQAVRGGYVNDRYKRIHSVIVGRAHMALITADIGAIMAHKKSAHQQPDLLSLVLATVTDKGIAGREYDLSLVEARDCYRAILSRLGGEHKDRVHVERQYINVIPDELREERWIFAD